MKKIRMSKLQKDLDEIVEICRGMALPFTFFFETKTGIKDLQPFAEKLAQHLPDTVSTEDKATYIHFFKSSVAYIMAMCPEDDQVVLSLNLISPVFFRMNGEQTVFEIMLETAQAYATSTLEKQFFDICLKEHALFVSSLDSKVDGDTFVKNVAFAVDQFLKKEKLFLSDKEYDGSEVQLCMSVMKKNLRRDFYKTMVLKHEK